MSIFSDIRKSLVRTLAKTPRRKRFIAGVAFLALAFVAAQFDHREVEKVAARNRRNPALELAQRGKKAVVVY